MNPATQDRIRKAAQDALADRDDTAALELLALLAPQLQLVSQPSPQLPFAALPPAKQVIEGPAHDYHYWMRLIREHFIPFMTENGRLKFTSHELLSWIQHRNDLAISTGDLITNSCGRETWRNIVGNALTALKQMGVVSAAPFSKDYTINTEQTSYATTQPLLT